jgi:hypothetical protein
MDVAVERDGAGFPRESDSILRTCSNNSERGALARTDATNDWSDKAFAIRESR